MRSNPERICANKATNTKHAKVKLKFQKQLKRRGQILDYLTVKHSQRIRSLRADSQGIAPRKTVPEQSRTTQLQPPHKATAVGRESASIGKIIYQTEDGINLPGQNDLLGNKSSGADESDSLVEL